MRTFLALCFAFMLLTIPAFAIADSNSSAQDRVAEKDACDRHLRRRVSHLAVQLKVQLQSQNTLKLDAFTILRGAREDFLRGPSDAAARRCYREFPSLEGRVQHHLRRVARRLLETSGRRLDQICTPQTDMYVSRAKNQISTLLAAEQMPAVSRRANELHAGLRELDFVRHCERRQEEVQSLLDTYLPAVLAKVDVAAYERELGLVVDRVFRVVRHVDEARNLQSQRSSIPVVLRSTGGQQWFSEQVRECTKLLSTFHELGGDMKKRLPGSLGLTGEYVGARCAELQGDLKAWFAAALALQASFEKPSQKLWERLALHGWGMEATYREFGRPLQEGRAGTRIEWTLSTPQSHCLKIQFGARGKEQSRQVVDCPVRDSETADSEPTS